MTSFAPSAADDVLFQFARSPFRCAGCRRGGRGLNVEAAPLRLLALL